MQKIILPHAYEVLAMRRDAKRALVAATRRDGYSNLSFAEVDFATRKVTEFAIPDRVQKALLGRNDVFYQLAVSYDLAGKKALVWCPDNDYSLFEFNLVTNAIRKIADRSDFERRGNLRLEGEDASTVGVGMALSPDGQTIALSVPGKTWDFAFAGHRRPKTILLNLRTKSVRVVGDGFPVCWPTADTIAAWARVQIRNGENGNPVLWIRSVNGRMIAKENYAMPWGMVGNRVMFVRSRSDNVYQVCLARPDLSKVENFGDLGGHITNETPQMLGVWGVP